MSHFKVLVMDNFYPNISNERRILGKIDAELLRTHDCKTEDDLLRFIDQKGQFDAIMTTFVPVRKKVLDSLSKLKVVARYGVGYDIIDIREASKHNVSVVYVPDYCIEEVSDHAIALLFACSRKIVQLNKHEKSGKWGFHIVKPFYRLNECTLGIIGLGRIGSKVAKKMSSFGINIIACDPFISEEKAKRYNIKLVSLSKLLKDSDYITLHVPLNKDTYHLIGKNEFNLIKKNAYIINTSRGKVINEKDLLEALEGNKIGGAALDVLEEEPIHNNPLINFENIILTPHTAFHSESSQAELQIKAAEGVADALIGKKPKYLVNNELWS